jgi:geranylgeranyl diphosphate synthase type II
MFATAYRLLSGIEPDLLPSILTIFSNTAIQVCEGQQYDMNFELVNTVSIPDYLNMIRLKTAVLPAACLQIGAMIAKAKIPDVEYIYQFGEKIGLAFQLMDDLLDVFGQEAKFGKQCGGDIIANKKTYLYLKAYELADIENKRKLDLLFSDIHIPDDEKIAGVKKIYETLEVANHVHRVMDELYINALQNLDRISVPEGRKSELLKFAKKLLSRES